MKYCSHCGRRLLDEAVICPGCGCEAGGGNQSNVYGYRSSSGSGYANSGYRSSSGGGYANSGYRSNSNSGYTNTGNGSRTNSSLSNTSYRAGIPQGNQYGRGGSTYGAPPVNNSAARNAPPAAAYSGTAADNTLIGKISERLKINGIIWIVIASLQILIGLCTLAAAVGFMPLILGVINLVGGIHDLNYSKEILSNPIGIVAKIEPIASQVIALLFNIFVGAFIGIVGSFYYFWGIRMLVMDNKEALLDIENRAQAQANRGTRYN